MFYLTACFDIMSWLLCIIIVPMKYKDMLQALQLFDEERENNMNELCKILANMAPFDGLLQAVRDRALSSKKSKGFESKLAAMQDSERFTKLKRAMEIGFFSMPTITPMLVTFLDEYEILCRDMPAGSQAESLVEALQKNFSDVSAMWQPAFAKAAEVLGTFSDAVCAALDGSAESGPAKAKWNEVIDTYTSAKATSGLQRCLTVMAGACTRTGIKAPEVLMQQKHTLMSFCALSNLVTATGHLCAVADEIVEGADAEKMVTLSNLVGEACKMLKEFENGFDEDHKVHALNCVTLINLYDV